MKNKNENKAIFIIVKIELPFVCIVHIIIIKGGMVAMRPAFPKPFWWSCHFNTLGLIIKCIYSMKSNTQWVNEIVFIIVRAMPSVELDSYL